VHTAVKQLQYLGLKILGGQSCHAESVGAMQPLGLARWHNPLGPVINATQAGKALRDMARICGDEAVARSRRPLSSFV
jgi:hypothetical protein